MDRDNRWDRVQACYQLLTEGKAAYQATTGVDGLAQAYARGEDDEFVAATLIHAADQDPVTIKDNDSVIFMNFRADRARELSRCFTEKNFSGFTRHATPAVHFTCLTQYADDIEAKVAYAPVSLDNVLGEYLAAQGKRQLRIAETEKYAHVTFFFNGGREQPFAGEERILIPSPDVATYDLQPQMSAPQLCDQLVDAILQRRYDVIICNIANPDMVGHTGNFAAAVTAIECVDECLGRIHQAIKDTAGQLLITADHGNAEQMYAENSDDAHTAHTSQPVPLVYVGAPAEFIIDDGALSDIAPTLLSLLDLAIPTKMTGRVLLHKS